MLSKLLRNRENIYAILIARVEARWLAYLLLEWLDDRHVRLDFLVLWRLRGLDVH